jgi:hypothetical protein
MCIDTTGDLKNCGSCGRDCMGTACQTGLCQAEVLASGQPSPTDIVVNATDVYWDTFGPSETVMTVPSGGGTPMTVATGQPGSAYLALSATGVYWTTATMGMSCCPPMLFCKFSVTKAPLGGGSPVSLVSSASCVLPTGLAADATNVYWFDLMAKTIYMVPSGGGTAVASVSTTSAPFLTAAGGYLFWGDTGIYQAQIGGTSNHIATTTSVVTGLAVDGTSVYWTDGDAVAKVPIGGGTVTTLAMAQKPKLAATDAAYVYYVENGTLKKVPTVGGAVVPLAPCAAAGLAVDATHVYWTDTTAGTVNRVAK